MGIEYKNTKHFTAAELQALFLSVNWSSGQYPDKLVTAMQNSGTVFSAWDGGRLVGLLNALDDGVMTAYVHYLLVHPDYQGKGIGQALTRQMLAHYQGYLRIVLIAYDNGIGFYEQCGFAAGEGKTPMFVTSLST